MNAVPPDPLGAEWGEPGPGAHEDRADRTRIRPSPATLLRLTNPPIVLLLTFTALAGAIIGGGAGRPDRVLEVGVAIALSSMGARVLTNYIDRDMDARMARTRSRPLPSGRVAPVDALSFGLLLVAGGLSVSALLGPLLPLLVGVGLVDNIVVYNLLTKRRTPWNIVLAAPSGGVPVLVGYASLTGRVDLTAVFLAALVVLWTPVHIWSLAVRYRDDYANARVPMLPVAIGVPGAIRCIAASTLLLAVFTVALPFAPGSPFGLLSLVLALALGGVMVAFSTALWYRPTLVRAWRLFKLTSPYLAVLFTVFALDVAVVRPPW